MTANYSLYAIPLYWVLALAPQFYATSTIKKANNNKYDNVNPKGSATTDNYKKTVPAAVFARYERAEAAHRNHMENAPWFIGALAIGNVAALPASTLNTVAAVYFGMRVFYTFVYINVTKQKYSYIRTATYLISSGFLFSLFWKAASKMATDSS